MEADDPAMANQARRPDHRGVSRLRHQPLALGVGVNVLQEVHYAQQRHGSVQLYQHCGRCSGNVFPELERRLIA